MSYLLTQMFLYLLVAFLLGLLLGWLLWRYGARPAGDIEAMQAEHQALQAERDQLQHDLNSCRHDTEQHSARFDRLRSENADLQDQLDAQRAQAAVIPAMPVVETPEVFEGEATKPEGLTGPRGGVADPLQEINGVGPKLEKLLHTLGYYHFDQIGAWTASEEAWVDENLEGFKGRVSRDNWIAQAKELAVR